MARVQALGDLDHDAHILVAPASAAETRNTSALELEHVVGLGPLVNAVFHLAVERRHNNLCAEHRLRERDRQIAPHVVTAALKQAVGAHVDKNVQVACGTAVVAGVAVTADVEDLLILDACRDRHIHGAALALSAGAAALAARIVDQLAGAVTRVAGALGLNDAERRTLVDGHASGAAARRTGLGLRALCRTGAVARVTGGNAVVGDRLFAALCRLFKGDGDARLHIGAALRHVAAVLPSAAEAAEKAGEYVVKIDTAAERTAAAGAAGAVVGIYTGMTELVVACALVFVGEHLVRLVDLLEFFFAFLVAGMQIGMVFFGALAKRLFDLVVARALVDAQHLVVISFVSHCLSSVCTV